MKFSCPYCQTPLEAADAFAGATVDCPTCGQAIVIGGPPMAAEPESLQEPAVSGPVEEAPAAPEPAPVPPPPPETPKAAPKFRVVRHGDFQNPQVPVSCTAEVVEEASAISESAPVQSRHPIPHQSVPKFRVVSRGVFSAGVANKDKMGTSGGKHQKKWAWGLAFAAVLALAAAWKFVWPTPVAEQVGPVQHPVTGSTVIQKAPAAGAVKTITLPGGATMDMVWCPPGTFMMGTGTPGSQRQVTLTKGFWMAKTEVTQHQWQSVMGTTLREQRNMADRTRPDCPRPILGEGGNYPMYYVNWEEAQAFCKRTGLQLPTEAQWEYACRAGSTGDYGGTGQLMGMGWFKDNSGATTHPVGQKQPNAWGLFDMHGNVWEWCADYRGTAATDPVGETSGMFLGRRGGAWLSIPGQCRSGYYDGFSPGNRESFQGFRPIKMS